MAANPSNVSGVGRIAWWKRSVIMGASFGAAFALVVSLVVGGVTWYRSRPKSWNTEAVKASYASLEFSMNENNFVVDFGYDLQNNTDSDYKIKASDLVVMARLAEGNVLSKSIGRYQASDGTVEAPAFIPAKAKGRVTVHVGYAYPFDFTANDKNDAKKVSKSVDRRLKEITGLVVFDQSNRYRIELPGGWLDIKPN